MFGVSWAEINQQHVKFLEYSKAAREEKEKLAEKVEFPGASVMS